MNFNRKGVVVIGILIIIGLLYIFDGNITGFSIYEPTECSVIEISKVWDEIFVESSSEARIYWNISSPSGICNGYLAIKNNSDQGWLLVGRIRPERGGIKSDVNGAWINLTDEGLAFWAAVDNYAHISILNILGNSPEDKIENWSISSPNVFSNYFDIGAGAWILNGDEDEWYSFNKEIVDNNITEESFGMIMKNISYAVYAFGSEAGYPIFLNNVSDMMLEINSSWSDGVNLDNYFVNVDEFTVIWKNGTSFSCYGCVEKINYTISAGNVVSFLPIYDNWTGTESFQIRGGNIEGAADFSNIFNVTVIENINDAPVLIKNISSIGVPMGGETTLYMDEYFEDPDGDSITYRVSGNKNMKINITGKIIIIQLNESFNKSIRIYIYASDGILETRSDHIWVFDSFKDTFLVVGNFSEDNNLSINISENGSNVDNITQDLKSVWVGELGWILWVVIGVVGVGILLFIIWFFILRKRGLGVKRSLQPSLLQTSTAQAPISDYLRKLNLPKK